MAKVSPVAVMVPDRQWSPAKRRQPPWIVKPEAVHTGPRSLMESGLSVSGPWPDGAKIEAAEGLPCVAPVRDNASDIW